MSGVGFYRSTILVPLDGSPRAEGALAVAERLGKSFQATLVLARVTAVVPMPFVASSGPLPAESYQQLLDDEQRVARDYVERQAKRLEEQGQAVKVVISEGDPAAALLDICSSEHVRLIVMTTHGRTGLARFALGSVADRLVRYGHVPVLLLRAHPPTAAAAGEKAAGPEVSLFDRILLPLDGSVLAEAALPLARDLAGAVIHHITLEKVLPLSADERTHTEAASYLEARAHELRYQLQGEDCSVTTLVREAVVTAEEISEQAQDEGSLVLMATHGRGGIRRWMLGSVASEVIHQGQAPVLLIHPDPAVAAFAGSSGRQVPVSVPDTKAARL